MQNAVSVEKLGEEKGGNDNIFQGIFRKTFLFSCRKKPLLKGKGFGGLLLEVVFASECRHGRARKGTKM